MQDPSSSSDPLVYLQSNGNLHHGGNDTTYCSNSTLSDSGSWDTDFEDDLHSESSGVYGDVGFCASEKPKTDSDGQVKSGVQGRVAALAKTVAASLGASGLTGIGSARPLQKPPGQIVSKHSGISNSSSHATPSRPSERPPLKPLKPPSKPPVPTRPHLLVEKPDLSQRPSPLHVDKRPTHSALHSSRNSTASSSSGVSCGSTSSVNLPKPPGSASEQVRQVIGALGQLWPSDTVSLSSQTQSDDDYELIDADEPLQSTMKVAPQRLKPHSSPVRSHVWQSEDTTSSIREPHSNLGQGLFRGNDLNTLNRETSPHSKRTSSPSPQSTPFLHSPAAAAALAAAAVSARSNRLSQCSTRSNGSDSAYSPSSTSSQHDRSPHTHPQDGVYEPIDENDQVTSLPQHSSHLHPADSSEKSCEVKRAATVPSVAPKSSQGLPDQRDQRPPVPNRPLPPTPRPPCDKPSGESGRSGSIAVGLEHHPWFHNVDRKRAEELIRNGIDGYFLIRPSSQSQNPLTLTLWYNQRVYNISVRQRRDGRIALGFEKPDEQSFASLEEMVANYQSENLLLFSRNERTGRTVLTTSPPKH